MQEYYTTLLAQIAFTNCDSTRAFKGIEKNPTNRGRTETSEFPAASGRTLMSRERYEGIVCQIGRVHKILEI